MNEEDKIFKGAIFLSSEYNNLELKVVGSPIAISGMMLKLFKDIIEKTLLEKSDIEMILKIATGEIDKNSKEYNEHLDRLTLMTLKEKR